MSKVWARPLRRQFFIAIVFVLAPVILAVGGLGLEEYRETVEELTDQTQAAALRTASAVERELTGLDRMARNLSTNPALQRLDVGAVESLLPPQRLQRPFLIGLVLIDREGLAVARSDTSQELSEEWKQLVAPVLSGESRVVSLLGITRSGVPYVIVTYPVRDGSDVIVGVLACYVNPQLLPDVFE